MTVHVNVLLGCQAQLPAWRDHVFLFKRFMISLIDGMQGIPQAHEFLFNGAIKLFSTASALPQVGICTSVKKCSKQALAKDSFDRLLHLGGQIVATQAIQAIQIAVNLSSISHRTINIVEIADNELSPVNKLVERLSPVSHRLAVGIIQGKHHLNVGGNGRAGQLGDKVVDGGHPRHQVRLAGGRAKFQLHVVREKLAATTIGKNETIILKILNLKVIMRYLLEKRNHYCQFLVVRKMPKAYFLMRMDKRMVRSNKMSLALPLPAISALARSNSLTMPSTLRSLMNGEKRVEKASSSRVR